MTDAEKQHRYRMNRLTRGYRLYMKGSIAPQPDQPGRIISHRTALITRCMETDND